MEEATGVVANLRLPLCVRLAKYAGGLHNRGRVVADLRPREKSTQHPHPFPADRPTADSAAKVREGYG